MTKRPRKLGNVRRRSALKALEGCAVTRAAQSAGRQKLRAWRRTRPLKQSQGAPVAG